MNIVGQLSKRDANGRVLTPVAGTVTTRDATPDQFGNAMRATVRDENGATYEIACSFLFDEEDGPIIGYVIGDEETNADFDRA